MATIGLDKLYYSVITIGSDGTETYGTPKSLAEAMTVEMSVETAEATLYSDDKASEVVNDFTKGTISLGVKDLSASTLADLIGVTSDANGVLVSTGSDEGSYVAIGFRGLRPNKKYRYFWLYKVKFSIPTTFLATKGESVEFSTPTIEGTIMQRNKKDVFGKTPWKVEVTEGDDGVTASVISAWYDTVYEPEDVDEV